MAKKPKKPTPKSQRQIFNDTVEPYIFPETGESYGNPNDTSTFKQFTDKEQNGVGFNRSNQLSFKNDTTKPFTIGLQDIDEAILYYFENVIKPTVYQNTERLPVPIIYGSPERWKSTQKDGYLKDKQGKIMSPIIMFKRDSMEKIRSIGNKLDANTPHLYSTWKTPYSNKNAYDNFSVLNNRKPVEQFILNVIPDYVKLTYNCAIQTYYVEQLNKIIEAVNYASDSYWGNPERFKFKATIDSYDTPLELVVGQDRIAKATFTINLLGHIIPDSIQKEIRSLKKYNSKAQIIIEAEMVHSVETLNKKLNRP
tara:strand:- start:8073 stop:9002 length:930 start_codon:yes stop_codon:yes gene_type:complete